MSSNSRGVIGRVEGCLLTVIDHCGAYVCIGDRLARQVKGTRYEMNSRIVKQLTGKEGQEGMYELTHISSVPEGIIYLEAKNA